MRNENPEYWDRSKECPGCRSIGKVRSEMAGLGWLNICDRCDLQWTSENPIEQSAEITELLASTDEDRSRKREKVLALRAELDETRYRKVR